MKRIFTGLLALFLTVMTLPVFANAAETDDIQQVRQLLIDSFCPENELAGDHSVPALEGGRYGEKVLLGDLTISQEDFRTVFDQVMDSCYVPWYARHCYYSTNTDTGNVYSIHPIYLDPSVYDRKIYEQKIAEILDTTIHEGMDDWQMALALHDYLVANCAYDEPLTLYRGHDAIVGGSAVCNGYAEAYQDLLFRVGIESVIVRSEEMDHAWNLVNLYGSWYHVDATWDDPISDTYGYVSHKYFLLTDQEISSEEYGHYGWKTDIVCDDATFCEAFWKEVDTAISYPNADVCYYRVHDRDSWQTRVVARDSATGEGSVIHVNDPKYFDIGTGQYLCYYHNSLTLWNGRLYANTMDSVYSMLPDGTDVRTEFSYDVFGNGKYIRSCFVKDATAYIELLDKNHDASSIQVTLDLNSAEPFHVHSYAPCVIEPTCMEGGFTAYLCECGVYFQEDYTLTSEHTYGEGVVTREPTPSQSGEVQYSCQVCGYVDTQQIDPVDTYDESSQDDSYVSESKKDNKERRKIITILCVIGVIGLLSSKKKR